MKEIILSITIIVLFVLVLIYGGTKKSELKHDIAIVVHKQYTPAMWVYGGGQQPESYILIFKRSNGYTYSVNRPDLFGLTSIGDTLAVDYVEFYSKWDGSLKSVQIENVYKLSNFTP
jgi:hypothetical protein